jgi:hypothetical protein
VGLEALKWWRQSPGTAMQRSMDWEDERTSLEKVEKLQAGFIGAATQDGGDIDSHTYWRLRRELLDDPTIHAKVPDFLRKCHNQGQFWQFIKTSFRPTVSAANTSGPHFGRSLSISNCRSGRRALNRSRSRLRRSILSTCMRLGKRRWIDAPPILMER